jgi:hypothetical protein
MRWCAAGIPTTQLEASWAKVDETPHPTLPLSQQAAQVYWHMYADPALWETKVSGSEARLRQKNGRSYLKNN